MYDPPTAIQSPAPAPAAAPISPIVQPAPVPFRPAITIVSTPASPTSTSTSTTPTTAIQSGLRSKPGSPGLSGISKILRRPTPSKSLSYDSETSPSPTPTPTSDGTRAVEQRWRWGDARCREEGAHRWYDRSHDLYLGRVLHCKCKSRHPSIICALSQAFDCSPKPSARLSTSMVKMCERSSPLTARLWARHGRMCRCYNGWQHPYYSQRRAARQARTRVWITLHSVCTPEPKTQSLAVDTLCSGGSTIVLLFEKGVVKWDEDLLPNGRSSLETLIRVGMGIGRSRRVPSNTTSLENISFGRPLLAIQLDTH
jgi:hypothetical protein